MGIPVGIPMGITMGIPIWESHGISHATSQGNSPIGIPIGIHMGNSMGIPMGVPMEGLMCLPMGFPTVISMECLEEPQGNSYKKCVLGPYGTRSITCVMRVRLAYQALLQSL